MLPSRVFTTKAQEPEARNGSEKYSWLEEVGAIPLRQEVRWGHATPARKTRHQLGSLNLILEMQGEHWKFYNERRASITNLLHTNMNLMLRKCVFFMERGLGGTRRKNRKLGKSYSEAASTSMRNKPCAGAAAGVSEEGWECEHTLIPPQPSRMTFISVLIPSHTKHGKETQHEDKKFYLDRAGHRRRHQPPSNTFTSVQVAPEVTAVPTSAQQEAHLDTPNELPNTAIYY